MNKSVTVVIPTYNRAEMLKRCIQSLCLQDYPREKFKVLIIDDGSDDETKIIYHSFLEKLNIDYIYQKHQGTGAARRLGIERAKTDLVAFIDDDCIASKSWLRQMTSRELGREVAAIGGLMKINNPKNIFECFVNQNLFGNGQNWQPTSFDPPFITTGNSIFRRSLAKKIGNFDRSLVVGEDLDIGWRLYFEGYKFRYEPKAIVYHEAPKSFKDHLKKNFSYGRANARVTLKHARKIAQYRKNPPEKVRNIEKIITGLRPRFWDYLSSWAFRLGYYLEVGKRR